MTNDTLETETSAGTGPEGGPRVGLHEGSVQMPAAYEDRSTNVFVPPDPQHEPNLNIARDWLHDGETLGDYVARQLGQLKGRLPGHKLLARSAETLGAGDAALAGERVDAQYRNGHQTIRQRQAVFLVAPQRALVFTASTPRPFDDDAERLWRGWLGSYLPAPAAAAACPAEAASDANETDVPHSGDPPA